MHDNVQEWNLNEFGNPQNIGDIGDEPRVLRGGSWGNSPDDARASVRNWNDPNDRYIVIGFRVLCWSPVGR